jgi:hypothetical protein
VDGSQAAHLDLARNDLAEPDGVGRRRSSGRRRIELLLGLLLVLGHLEVHAVAIAVSSGEGSPSSSSSMVVHVLLRVAHEDRSLLLLLLFQVNIQNVFVFVIVHCTIPRDTLAYIPLNSGPQL